MTTARVGPVSAGLHDVLAHVAPLTGGTLADYIEPLTRADPEWFGLSLVSMDGHVYTAGDAAVEFTIQSISKPFVYALALADLGVEAVLARVGVEPSGAAFDAISLDPVSGRPANPMINAGAMLTTSLVQASGREERCARILSTLSAFAGRPLTVDDDVAASELATASRNRAIALLMDSAGALQADVEETIEAYCRQCAVAVTAADLGVMAATLANGGVNPVSGMAVVSEDVAARTLAVMATSGMYDYSGEWLMRIGLPAKSGVAGGLIAASPAAFGVGVFSPRLDERGNTVRGIAVARELADRFDLHLMHHPGRTAPVVYDTAIEPAEDGRPIAVLAAQGDLEFAAAERLLWALDEALGDDPLALAGLLLDLHRVTRVHHVAERMLDVALVELVERGLPVAIVQQDGIAERISASVRFASRDAAHAWCFGGGGVPQT